jgi:hypothetical protein
MGDLGPAVRCFTAACDFPQNQQMRSEDRDQDLSIRTLDSTVSILPTWLPSLSS